MDGVDTSVYSQLAKPQQFDPNAVLQMVQRANDIRQFQAQQAGSQAYQRAINPQTGMVDPTLAGQYLRADPNAALAVPELAQRAATLSGTYTNNAAMRTQLAQNQTQFIRDSLGALAGKPGLSTGDVIHSMLGIARNVPDMPTEMIDGIINAAHNLPPPSKDNPEPLRRFVQTLQAQGLGAAGTATRVTGPPNPVTGQSTTVPMGSALYGEQPAAASIPGQVSTSLPPSAEVSAAARQADLMRAGNYQQTIFPLEQAYQKLKALGPGGVGPGTEERQNWASFAYALAPAWSKYFNIDPEKLQNYDEAKKYLTQAVMTSGTISHGTDQQLATALTGNPNVKVNDLAAVDLTRMAIARARMEQAQILTSAKSRTLDYNEAKAAFANNQDPRAYAIDLMSPEQIEDLKKNLKGAERAKFNASLKAAIDSGVVSRPQ